METLPVINPEAETGRIVAFIKDTFTRSGKTTAVLGLSGGVDSATSLALAVKALGPDHVLAYHLPAKNSSTQSLEHARLAAQTAGLPDDRLTVIPIGSVIQKSWRIQKHYTQKADEASIFQRAASSASVEHRGEAKRSSSTEKIDASPMWVNRLRLANLAARIRMLILYDQAKRHDALVIGTENLSEHLLGYYTRFGDEASDLEPLRHLYKTQVYPLARHLGVPEPILTKPPSADLWRGQTDAGELGFTYETADPILHLHTQGKTAADITAAGFDPTFIARILSQVQNSAFKHEVPYTI